MWRERRHAGRKRTINLRMADVPQVLNDVFERAGLVEKTNQTRRKVSVSMNARNPDDGQTVAAPSRICAACGSKNTRCISHKGAYGKEQFEDTEVHCGDCGVFSYWTYHAF